MDNIIQTVFNLIPYFKIDYLSLFPILGLIIIGLLIEKHYVSKLTFFSNSIALVSYFGMKDSLSVFGGLVVIVYFGLSSWSFLSYITKNKIPQLKKYEKFVEDNSWVLKIGSSLITGSVILADMFQVI